MSTKKFFIILFALIPVAFGIYFGRFALVANRQAEINQSSFGQEFKALWAKEILSVKQTGEFYWPVWPTEPTPTSTPVLDLSKAVRIDGYRDGIVSVRIRHLCYRSDLSDCNGMVVSLMSDTEGGEFYINDTKEQASYLIVYGEWTTVVWNDTLAISPKNTFPIITP